MTEVVYTQIELNPARTFITGVWCDGVYFSTEPPMAYTPGNAQWVKDQVITLAKEDEACERWRTNAKALARRRDLEEFRKRQYQFELQQENYIRAAVRHLESAARDEIKAESKQLDNAWLKVAEYQYQPPTKDYNREYKMTYERVVNNRTYKKIGEMFGVSTSRASMIIKRKLRNDRWFDYRGYRDFQPEIKITEPPAEAADHGEGVEWTPETQHQEFELLRGIR